MRTAPTRRRFLTTLSLAGAAGLTHKPSLLAAEGSLETTTIRLAKNAGICIAPQYAAEELLRAEGFTDVRYVFTEPGIPQAEAIGHGDVDFSVNFVAPLIIPLDAGIPRSNRSRCSQTGKSTRSSAFRPSHRSCALVRSDM
jgi:NitT/TauT family transport system substrate-binding protein